MTGGRKPSKERGGIIASLLVPRKVLYAHVQTTLEVQLREQEKYD